MITMGFSLALTLAMLGVVVLDASRYLIPNSLNFAILLLWLAGIYFLPIHVLPALAAAGIILLVGLGLFALGLMGGGDIKLLVVLALWTGWGTATAEFLILTAFVGGILVIVLLILRSLVQVVMKGRNLPRILIHKQPVPYGLAIAGAFLLVLWQHHIPALAAVR